MATTELSHAQIAVASFADRIGRGVVIMINEVIDWHQSRKTRRILSALSDEELYDIGLARTDIDRVAG